MSEPLTPLDEVAYQSFLQGAKEGVRAKMRVSFNRTRGDFETAALIGLAEHLRATDSIQLANLEADRYEGLTGRTISRTLSAEFWAQAPTPGSAATENYYPGVYTGTPMRGPKGDKGDAGERGVDGARGRDGAAGAPGPKGDKGDKGDPGEPGTGGGTGNGYFPGGWN